AGSSAWSPARARLTRASSCRRTTGADARRRMPLSRLAPARPPASARVALAHAGEHQRQMDVAGNGAPRKQRRLLEYEAERLFSRPVHVVGRLWPIDRSGRWRCEPGDQFEQRRFSAARGTQQADELARPDIKIDASQRGRAVGKRLRNAAEAE